jgi:hypothetical protein
MTKLFAELLEKQTPSPAPTPPSAQPPETPVSIPDQTASVPTPEQTLTPPKLKPETKRPKMSERPMLAVEQASNTESKDAANIAILQLSKSDIDELRATAYKNQTFRFSEDELNWLKDRSYGLSRALGRKVGQNDLLRLALRVFRKVVGNKQELLEEIIDPII